MRNIDYEMEEACARVHAALGDLGWPVPAGRELRPVLADRWWWLLYTGVDARHLYCTDLLSRGVALNDVAAMAGHSSPMVTASIYVNKQASTLDRVRAHLAS